MKRNLLTITLVMTVMLLAQIAAPAQEPVGTSCEDCPFYNGAFTVNNNTGVRIIYYQRWGKKNPWKKMILESGQTMRHSYPLGENPRQTVPRPYIMFDSIGGDGRNTYVEVPMKFYSVLVKPGYGPSRVMSGQDEPKPYYFRYQPNGRDLYIYDWR